MVHILALLVQQVEQRCGFLADEVQAATVVDVVDVVPGDALGPVLFLQARRRVNDYFRLSSCTGTICRIGFCPDAFL